MSGSTHAHTRPSARRPEFEPPSRWRVRRPRRRTRRRLAVGAGLLLLAVAVAAFVLTRSDDPAQSSAANRDLRPAGRVLGPPIPIGGSPSSVVSSPDGIWVVTAPEGRIFRFDQQLSRMQRPGALIGGRPVALAAAFRSIWVASSDSNMVSRFSPHTGLVLERIPVGDSPSWLTADDQGLWVVNREDDTLMRIDPTTNRVSGRPIKVGDDPTAVAYGHKAVWVTNSGDDTVSRIDPRTHEAVNHRRRRPSDRLDPLGQGGVGGELRGRQPSAHRHYDQSRRCDDPRRRRPESPPDGEDDLGSQHSRRHADTDRPADRPRHRPAGQDRSDCGSGEHRGGEPLGHQLSPTRPSHASKAPSSSAVHSLLQRRLRLLDLLTRRNQVLSGLACRLGIAVLGRRGHRA